MKSHSNIISDGVEISSCHLKIRKGSKTTSSPDFIQRNIIGNSDCPVAVQRDDDESLASSVGSFVMLMSQQRVSSDAVFKSEGNIKAIRRHVFDEMYEYYESNSPGAESGLAPPSNDEMWFGDLDFSTLVAFIWVKCLVITLIILLLSNKLLSLRLCQDTR